MKLKTRLKISIPLVIVYIASVIMLTFVKEWGSIVMWTVITISVISSILLIVLYIYLINDNIEQIEKLINNKHYK